MLLGSLLVAEHGDAARRQAVGQIAKRLVGADRLVAVVRAGEIAEPAAATQERVMELAVQ